MLAVVIAEGIAIFLLGLLVAGLLRSHAEILRALHELGAGIDPDDAEPRRSRSSRATTGVTGTAAHDIAGVSPSGEAVALAVTNVEHDTLLAFLSTGCDTCRPFWTALQHDLGLPDVRALVIVSDEESESELVRLTPPGIDVIASTAAWSAYEVPGAPHFVYVDGSTGRVVGEGTGPDWPSVRALLMQANADRAPQLDNGPGPVPIEWRDNPARIDAELLAAGIGPGHHSLASSPDPDRTA